MAGLDPAIHVFCIGVTPRRGLPHKLVGRHEKPDPEHFSALGNVNYPAHLWDERLE
jgi:hypothetical protein